MQQISDFHMAPTILSQRYDIIREATDNQTEKQPYFIQCTTATSITSGGSKHNTQVATVRNKHSIADPANISRSPSVLLNKFTMGNKPK